MSSLSIELRGVSRKYGKGAAALDELDLAIHEGERLAVLGPSGSGKTTLLRLIAGLEQPDAGIIRIGGLNMEDVPPHRRDAAMVFQTPALYPHLSVLKNLGFGLKARGVGRRERHTRAKEIAEMLGLGQLLNRKPDELSGGERQRVALGRAVVRKPAVLLLDEPFSNLDEPLRAALRSELVDLHRRFGCTLVHVTHDQAEALSLGDRVAVLRAGRLMQIGPPRTIFDEPAHQFVASFVGSPGMRFLPLDVVREADRLRFSTIDGKHSVEFPMNDERNNVILPLGEPRRLAAGLRPFEVTVSSETLVDPSDSRHPFLPLPAVVRRVELQGYWKLVTLDVDGQTLMSGVPSFHRVREDERVVAHIALWRASWFDPETRLRVELHCQPSAEAIG